MGHHPSQVVVDSSHGWKLLLAVGLVGAIVCGACGRPPHWVVARAELRRLVLAAMALYGVGLLASLADRGELAALVYAGGILVCSLAVWLSRGVDADEGPGEGPAGEGPVDEPRPPGDGAPEFDWDAFERELRAYSDRLPV
jgi:hypothetical protein